MLRILSSQIKKINNNNFDLKFRVSLKVVYLQRIFFNTGNH